MTWIVYCTTCLVNGKIYIGVHKTENPKVFDGYLGNGIEIGYSLKYPKTAFQYALKKHGYKNFKRATLFEFDNEEDAYKKEAEIVTYDFIKRRDNYNVVPGGLHGGCKQKWIYQYDIEGNYIGEFYGVKHHAEEIGCNPMTLIMACAEHRSYRNSYWAYEKVEKLDLSTYKLNLFSTIYQFTPEGELVGEWDTVAEIVKAFDTTKANVYSALNKKTQAKGFYFLKNKEKMIDILKSKEVYNNLPKLKCGEKRKIAQYDLEGNLIKVWDAVKDCAKEFSKCRDVAKGLRKQTKGFVFKYVE